MNTQKIKTAMLKVLGEGITASLHGLRFACLLKFSGRQLDPEIELLPEWLSEGEVAVDVGANGADWTLYLSKAVGASGRVFAFEADPYYARATLSAIRWLGLRQVTMFPFGLADKEEDVPLRIVDDDGMRESGLGRVDKSASNTDQGVRMISLKTLDSLREKCPELLGVALIKCDVEGYELFVLKGAYKTITGSRPIIIVETEAFAQQGYSASDLTEYLKGDGYSPYAMVKGGRLAPVGADLVCAEALSINRIFIHAERHGSIDNEMEA